MSKSPFSLALEQGYGSFPIIPLRPKSKIPFVQGWSKYCETPPTQEELADWGHIPNANVGLALGAASGIIALDFDYNIDGLHEKILKHIPVSPIRKVGARGFTMFYKYNGELPHKWTVGGQMVLELLSTGNHTVLPPSIHPEGGVYRYSSTLQLVSNTNRLQPLPEGFKSFVDMEVRGKEIDIIEPKEFNLDEIRAALDYIDPEDYEVWVKVGMALKEAMDVDGFTVWSDWSKRSTKCVPHELLSKWNSFKREGVSLGTIFYYAKNNGYNKPEVVDTEVLVNLEAVKATLAQWRIHGKPVGESYGWPCMDNLIHIRKGEFTIVTGYTNQGKSEFMDAVSVNLIKNLDWKVGMISMEKCKENHVAQLIHSLAGRPINVLSDDEINQAYSRISSNALIVDHLNIGKDLSTLEKVIRFLVTSRKADVIVIDPFNYIETTDDALYSHVINVAKKCTNLAKELNVHIFLVAHAKDAVYNKEGVLQKPRLYSVFGGTQFSNLVDNLIGVTRMDGAVKVETLKIRDQDQDSYGTATLFFNKETRSYYEKTDHKF